MMNRRSPEVEEVRREVRRGGFTSSQSQRWQRGGGEEHAAWMRRPGWGPSGQPSLSSKRSFWRPVNAHAGHQQKTVSHPDASAAVRHVQSAPPEEFEVALSTPVKIDHKQPALQHQVPQHLPPPQQQQEQQHQQAVAVVPSLIQMPPGLPASIVSHPLDAPSIQQNQLLQQAVLHQGRETEETKFDKGTYSSLQMTALPNSTTQSKLVGNHSRMPWSRGGYHAYRRQQKRPMLHKSNKKYVVAKLELVKLRQLNAVLNKLTPQNFNIIVREVQEVNIDNVGTLSLFISQIYLRAVMEPAFCQVYAQLCSQLNWSLPSFNVDDRIITLKRLLLNHCQEGFERGESKEAEAGKAEEETETKQTQDEREETITWDKRRYLGNIRFIGELFRAESLSVGIIHRCIKKLLGSLEDPDEGKIEGMCQWMNAIGYMIDQPKSKREMDVYFDTMEKLSTDEKLSWRVRFLLRDLIELRENKWHSGGGGEEHAAWSSSSGGWGPSGQPSLSSSSKRSFWRPVNAHAEHQQKPVSHPDAAAVQQFPATTSTSCHQTLTLNELKLKDQQPREATDTHTG